MVVKNSDSLVTQTHSIHGIGTYIYLHDWLIFMVFIRR